MIKHDVQMGPIVDHPQSKRFSAIRNAHLCSSFSMVRHPGKNEGDPVVHSYKRRERER